MQGTNFQGDRGANRLATNNERELVPYFIEDTVCCLTENPTLCNTIATEARKGSAYCSGLTERLGRWGTTLTELMMFPLLSCYFGSRK